jgi:hypothetical protein
MPVTSDRCDLQRGVSTFLRFFDVISMFAIRIQLFFAVAVASWLAGPAAAYSLAESFSLNPVADAFVVSSEPASNYGAAGVIGVSAPGLVNGEFQSLLRFDLAGAKTSFDAAFGGGNWGISSATLQLAAASPNNSLFNASSAGQFQVSWLENDSWIEGTGSPTSPATTGITFNALPSILSANDQPLGTFSFDGSTTATAMYSLTAGSGLMNDVVTGSLASIRLSAAAGDTTVSGLFNSRSFNTTSRRPLLTLNAVAVPEPATWILVASGLAVLMTLLRFRRRYND